MKYYILLLPFSFAFALSPAIPIYLVYLVFFSMKELVLKKIVFRLAYEDIVILSFLYLAFVSFVINEIFIFQSGTFKVGHLLAYCVTICYFYLFVKWMIISFFRDNSLCLLLSYIYMATYIVVIFVIVEFFLKNTFAVSFDGILPRPSTSAMDARALGFFRAYGLSSEPGHTAMFIEIMAPLGAYFLILKKRYTQLFLFLSLSLLSLIFTFSAAAFVILPLAIFMSLLLFVFTGKMLKRFFYKFFLYIVSFLVIVFLLSYFLDTLFFLDLGKQVMGKLSADNSSASARLERLEGFYTVFYNADIVNVLIGYGPGAYKNLAIDSVISLYPTLLLETGLIGLVIFSLFLLSVFLKIFKKSGEIKFFFFISFFSATMHFLIISNYWYPWFWFLSSLILAYRPNEVKVQNVA